ncbi:BrnT family toxin [Methylopila henanensis]|uniref:BrnT family toxin n=1 Tax=Methylopila henanensis TaxID=873516 RepID=A0ABW4K9T0_9HYPH
MYIQVTIITWDEPKRLANIEQHAMDFADLTDAFFLTAVIRPSYGGRFLAIGLLNGERVTAVVYRSLGSEAFSIVSMRPANVQERRLFNG